jgi:hypothetical protein
MTDNAFLKFLILSYGRSGSVLLASTVGSRYNAAPRYVQDGDALSDAVVQHSHLFFENSQTADYQRIFNLRRNPVDTVLSLILATQYQQYHKFTGHDLEFESFEFTKWHMIDGACEFYQAYHYWYSQRLQPNDLVIFYEDFVRQLQNPTRVYEPIYPDKAQLITNYQQVLEYVGQQQKSLLVSQQAFVDHVGNTDYSVIS